MEPCECCSRGILEMMHFFWWLLSKLLVAVGCCLWAGCGAGEQLWHWPTLGGWVCPCSAALLVCPEVSSWRVVAEAHCRQWSSVVAWLTEPSRWPSPGLRPWCQPGSSAVAIWHCGLVTCTSCAIPAPDLVCSECNTSLVAGQWWLCALRIFLSNLSDLALKRSVWNAPIQQWFSFLSGLEMCENILLAYQQQCHLYPA